MSEEIIKVLDKLGEKLGMAIDWSGENVLPYIEELAQRATNWLMCEAIVLASVCLILAATMLVIGIRFVTMASKSGDADDAGAGVICIVIGALLLIPVVANILQIVKCCTCPELALLPFIQGLL